MSVAPFQIEEGGRVYRLRPLTVRERMALVEAHVAYEREKALSIVKASGMPAKDGLAFIGDAVEKAERVSAIVMDCFTLRGALAVLRVSLGSEEEVDSLASSVEPGRLSVLAARCLSVNTEEKADSGNE
jgi:hypothetical protein